MKLPSTKSLKTNCFSYLCRIIYREQQMMRPLLFFYCIFWFAQLGYTQTVTELARFSAPNATQAVAVDELYFYAISNSKIVKHRKTDGSVVKTYSGTFKHLNSGIILEGKLYCANTNYPELPMASSLEIFDPKTLEHIGTHSFGMYIGSFTWIDRWKKDWYLMFVHYENYAQERNKGVEYSSLVQMDKAFRQKGGWTLPKALVERLRPESISGGCFAKDGKLYMSPHHFEEIYVMQIPSQGYELEWIKTIPVPFEGQGFALDPAQDGVLWGIHRKQREVICIRIK